MKYFKTLALTLIKALSRLSFLVGLGLILFQSVSWAANKSGFNIKNTVAASTTINTQSISDSLNKGFIAEKVFIHTDKDFYSATDTVWFKAYLYDAKTNDYSKFSNLLYLELITDSSKLVKRICVPVGLGLAWGQIILDKNSVDEGYYTLRAYTNYMQNFPEECFFKKGIYITNPQETPWLLNSDSKIENKDGKDVLMLSAKLKDLKGNISPSEPLEWTLNIGDKTLVKRQTGVAALEESMELPEKLKAPLVLTVKSKKDPSKQLKIPLRTSYDEEVDLQFLPESGHLVAGITSKVGFKAVGANGLGKSLEGVVKDSKNDIIASFKTTYKGMGSFEITPAPDEKYVAELKLPDGKTSSFALPKVSSSGAVLRVFNNPADNFIRVFVLFSPDLVNSKAYTLTGFSRGRAFYKADFQSKISRISTTIPKDKFPTGIVHLTLFDDDDKPLNERITFINNHDIETAIDVKGSKIYAPKDSIHLSFAAGTSSGVSMSVSVTDDSQVNADSLSENILSSIFLSSELKGNIESPGFYFREKPESAEALELLMLTQGWKCYNWEEVLKPLSPAKYQPELGFKISGRVLNVMNKPVENAKISLLGSGKQLLLMDTLTNQDGRFEFRNFPPLDTASFVVRARNARGKGFNVGIEKEEFVPAGIGSVLHYPFLPWYAGSDSSLVAFARASKLREDLKEKDLAGGATLLQEVKITAKKAVKGSQNLNGAGAADLVIDEATIRKQGDKNLLQFLLENVSGLHTRAKNTANPKVYYYLHDRRAKFVVDGMELDFGYSEETSDVHDYLNFVKRTIGDIATKDVVGIEIMFSTKYVSKYDLRFSDPGSAMMNVNTLSSANNNAYIEITTRSGNGLTMRSNPGVAVYRPLPITWPVKFYSPRYNLTSSAVIKNNDLRSTIHWEPNLITDKNGNATLSFYALNKEGTYTLSVQGSDMNGKMTYKILKLKVSAEAGTTSSK